ncbi:aminofutalosine synthase MqnE [Micromonospora sp. NPDC049559]|uniref:aminofutalosine synthase MqnE n=1 Tax=Micromonospora sp. NPDC049559 TaxID=3155923 RepID=UPI00342485B8
MDAGLKRELEAKVYAGERLSRADGIALYDSDDLAWLGRLAHHRRTALGGDRVLFGVDRRLELTGDEPVAAAARLRDEEPTALYLVEGPDPALSWEHYPRLLAELRTALPGVALLALSATGLRRFERLTGRSADDLLDELVEAGLTALTGADAEIFDPEVRARSGGDGCDWADWSRIHRLAHAKGLRTAAAMRYGHVEEAPHRVDHVLRLRELQDETGGFPTFVPLRRRPDPAATGHEVPPAADTLRTLAVSRLLLDNVPHLNGAWAGHGISTAQLALSFGVDDLDSTPGAEPVTAATGGEPDLLHRDDLLQLIWDGGFRPVERNARYEVLREYDAPPSLAERRAEPQRVWA